METKEIHVIAFTFFEKSGFLAVVDCSFVWLGQSQFTLIWMKIGTFSDKKHSFSICFVCPFIHSFIYSKSEICFNHHSNHTHTQRDRETHTHTKFALFYCGHRCYYLGKLLFSFHCVSTHGKKNGFLTTIINVILETFAVKSYFRTVTGSGIFGYSECGVARHHHLTLLFLNKIFCFVRVIFRIFR